MKDSVVIRVLSFTTILDKGEILMGRIGFIQDDEEEYYEEESETTVGSADSDNTLDLSGEIIAAMNILIDIMKFHNGTIKGITIAVNNQGVRSTKLDY